MSHAIHAESTVLDRATTRVRILSHGEPLSLAEALELCRSDAAFRAQLIATLASSPCAAFFWELPPIMTKSLAQPFEFVLSDAHGLAGAAPEIAAFQAHFSKDRDRDGVVVFENLGGDATLVVPCPLASPAVYAHIATFVRQAPEAQRHALLRCVAHEVLARASTRPLWLSTAGMGVYWLHVRLDSRPKYYRHAPYKLAHGEE